MIIMEQPNAQKRAAKAARLQEQKVERRAREKEAKKRKRQERAQAGDAAEPRKRRKMGRSDQISFAAQVVIDLGFDDMMTDKRESTIVYSVYITIFTSLNGRTKARLDAINDAGYKRWTNTKWWEEGYDRIWTSKSDSCDGDEGFGTHRASVVYLTADSEEELMELKEGEIYVIGGICDHNRYKNLCLDKAKTSIYSIVSDEEGAHGQPGFEILLKWVETRDWEQAFWSVIPKRKFQRKMTNLDPSPEGEHVEEGEGQDSEDQEDGDGPGAEVVASSEDGKENDQDDGVSRSQPQSVLSMACQ
ncbi:hypothetical protein BDR07DRAFT_1456622 [Suillus spraguei]|nr:hypothetical protein BDR07DRAFT_1456622 [Suillus spraguei]